MKNKIQDWAFARNLHTADKTKQMLKLMEEVGELASALAKNNINGIIDGIGDIYVVLTILSLQLGLDIDDCIKSAYEEIKDRKGKLIDGVFVKETDLPKGGKNEQ
jgi:NTP pyrophosphatase (non-canonical NTP hydrolase)